MPHRIAMFDLIEAADSDAPRYVHPASSGMDDRALSDYYNRYAAMDYTTWNFDLHKVGATATSTSSTSSDAMPRPSIANGWNHRASTLAVRPRSRTTTDR